MINRRFDFHGEFVLDGFAMRWMDEHRENLNQLHENPRRQQEYIQAMDELYALSEEVKHNLTCRPTK